MLLWLNETSLGGKMCGRMEHLRACKFGHVQQAEERGNYRTFATSFYRAQRNWRIPRRRPSM